MRVLVCGGRNFTDRPWLFSVLDTIYTQASISLIIQGGAPGADRYAKHWAIQRRVKQQEFPADWERYGKRAGFIRNELMLKQGNPDLVVAFPGGRGTDMMINLSLYANVPLVLPEKDKPLQLEDL